MTGAEELVGKVKSIGERLVEAGQQRFAEHLRPKLRDLIVRGTELKLREARGEDVAVAMAAIESQLSDIGVQERLLIVQTQFDVALQVLLEVADLAT